MKRVSDRFLQVGVLALLVGVGLGIWMGANQNFTLHAVHAHINLLGFASMMLFGLFYRVIPQAVGKLSTVHFVLSVVGTTVMLGALSQVVLGNTAMEPVLIAGEMTTRAVPRSRERSASS